VRDASTARTPAAAAECNVRVGAARQPITDLYPMLTEVRVEMSRAQADVATLMFDSRRDASGRWRVQDAGTLEEWAPIQIDARFGAVEQEVFRGYIRKVEADYPPEAAAATVTVTCQDESLALDRAHRRRTWGAQRPTSDLAVLVQILGEHPGLALDPASAGGLSGLSLTQDASDIRFLTERAEANGYELIVRRGTLYFGPPRLDAPLQPTILVHAGPDTNAYRFNATVDAHQPDRVAFEMAAEEGTSTVSETVDPDLPLLGSSPATSRRAGLQDFVWRMGRQAGSREELRARAQGLANERSMRVRAEGELDGSVYRHVLLPGLLVGVDGVGRRLGGRYYVDHVTHRFTTEGYRASFVLLRNGHGNDLSTAFTDRLAPVR
jgi:phage protein D